MRVLHNDTWPQSAEVAPDMHVRLFPGYAQKLDHGEWLLSLRGWVSDARITSPRRRLTCQALQKAVWTAVHGAGDDSDTVDRGTAANAITHSKADAHRRVRLRKRVSIFITRCRRNVAVALQLPTAHGEQLWSSRTNSAGHFTVHAVVDERELLASAGGSESAQPLPGGAWLTTVATTPAADGRVFTTRVLMIPPHGVSVISDIDDTIKETFVCSTRRMLRSTFLEAWRPVAGMAELYRAWAARGVAFHYVSSSPWQLQGQLEELLDKAGFPFGTFHLKDLHYKGRRLLNLFRSSTKLKPKQISNILKSFPHRSFVLVGDSGEKDAQIYSEIARRHSSQIRHVYIRNVATRQLGKTTVEETRERLARHFRGLPDDSWTVFESADELAAGSKRCAWMKEAATTAPATAGAHGGGPQDTSGATSAPGLVSQLANRLLSSVSSLRL